MFAGSNPVTATKPNKPLNKNIMAIKKQKKSTVTIVIPLHIAETLEGFIDGGIGTSDDDQFSKQMKVVMKELKKELSKHYF